jgi:uncharacterized membrane protein
MTIKSKTTNVLVASAVVATLSAMAMSPAHAISKGKEKCYGVVKAGQNGCGDAAGKHSCQGYAETDGQWSEWVALPKGVCDKLVGGSLEAMEPKAEVAPMVKEEMAK